MKKTFLISSVAVLSLGIATVSYANSYTSTNNNINTNQSIKTEGNSRNFCINESQHIDQNHFQTMLDYMNKSELTDAAETMRNGNRHNMHQVINNMNDRDYDKMMSIMKDVRQGHMNNKVENKDRRNNKRSEHHREMRAHKSNKGLGCQQINSPIEK